jgi:hypothetical protein
MVRQRWVGMIAGTGLALAGADGRLGAGELPDGLLGGVDW